MSDRFELFLFSLALVAVVCLAFIGLIAIENGVL
jgi:hypothetical protein